MSNPRKPSPFEGTGREFARHIIPLLQDRQFLAQALSEWLTVPEAAAYLKVSDTALRTLVNRRRVPFHKPSGRMIRFKRSELDKWLGSHRVDADA